MLWQIHFSDIDSSFSDYTAQYIMHKIMSPMLMMSNLELLQLILDGTGFSSDRSQLDIRVHVHYSVNVHVHNIAQKC